MNLSEEKGFSLTSYLITIGFIIFFAALGLQVFETYISVNAESISFTNYPANINNTSTGNGQIEIVFDRRVLRNQIIKVEIWEFDENEGDDPLIQTTATLIAGESKLIVPFTLNCSAEGFLNGDTDDGDKEYEIYGWAKDDQGNEVVTQIQNIQCVNE
jgi:hypothetical protein